MSSTLEQARQRCLDLSGSYYSNDALRFVHHTHMDCPAGRRIEQRNLRCGTEKGRTECGTCQRLNGGAITD